MAKNLPILPTSSMYCKTGGYRDSSQRAPTYIGHISPLDNVRAIMDGCEVPLVTGYTVR